MTGPGRKVGTGYVPIKPDTEGFGPELKRGVEAEGTAAAREAGAALSTAMRGAFLGGVALMGKSVFEFADFDAGMREVFTVLPDISGQAMDDMTAQAKDFAAEFGVIPQQVSGALYEAIGAGVAQDEVFTFLEEAQKLAKAGATDIGVAVDGLSTVVNAYGGEVINAQRASDILFKTVGLGKGTVDEVASSLYNVIPIAATFGVSFEDVGASLAALTAQGVPVASATTAMRGVIAELGKEGTEVSKIFGERTGKSFQQFIADGGNLQNALMVLDDAAAETGTSVLDMFGSIEAGSAAAALVAGGGEQFFEFTNAMQDSAGSTQAAFETMNEGMAASMDRMKARLSVAFINLGESLAPQVEDIVNAFADLLDIFAALPGPMQKFVIVGGTITAGLIGFAGPILKAVKLFSMLGKTMTLLAANPWLLAAIALGTIAYLIITHWEEVSAFFVEFGETITEVWASVSVATVGFAEDTYNTVIGTFDEIAAFFTNYWPFILGIFTGGLGLIVGLVIQNWDAIWGKTVAIYDAIVGKITGAWDAAYNATTNVGGKIIGFIVGIPTAIADAFKTLAEVISAPFRTAFQGIKSAWNSTVGGYGFDVPGWIPGVGGRAFRIPSMATGGILTDPTLFLGGEYVGARRDPEIVTPQSMMRDTVINALADVGGSRRGETNIYLTMKVDAGVTDPRFFERQAVEVARVVARELDRERDAGGITATTRGVLTS